ncbi:MAG: glycoside hydrolase family 97 C-terminal domain-containing protein [Fulvivirga sp.]
MGRTNDETARTSTINFNFLPEGRRYIATIHSHKKDAHTKPIRRLMRMW